MKKNKFTLHLGDCLVVMDDLEENSIDTCITDPPYGLEFMGKDWDHGIPGVPFWEKILKLLKPGGSLLSFGGTRTHHRLMVSIEDSGFEIRDCLMWLHGNGLPKGYNFKIDGWKGWGTTLKPAWEPIVLATKSRKGTFVDNAIEYGVAGLNIDGSRIGPRDRTEYGLKNAKRSQGNTYGDTKGTSADFDSTKGRWPSNLILDEQAAKLLDEQGGDKKPGGKTRGTEPSRVGDHGVYGRFKSANAHDGYPDFGGASRFFYCAKASRKERGEGNNHPTVKPLDLMRYLCRLTKTPTSGVVLDPFMGSGSTGIACLLEGRKFIGIEIDPEYWQIAKDRIENCLTPLDMLIEEK